MLQNYLKIALRNLLRNKVYSLINIVGFAIGLCFFLLISYYIIDELSYDKHLKNAGRIFRVQTLVKFGGTELDMAQSSDPMGATLKKDYPQVEQYARLYASDGRKFIKKGNEFLIENNIANADSTFFDIFSFPIAEGNIKTALNEPNTVVISRKMAEKYFGTVHAVGKTLMVGVTKTQPYKVNAVFENMPKNTHFNFDFLFSMKNVEYGFGNYLSNNFLTYIRLKEGTNYHEFEKNFPAFTDRYILPQAQNIVKIRSMAEFRNGGNRFEISLIPMIDIHLYSHKMGELANNGDIQYVKIFGIVALFLLLIACINFMNLSTARSIGRSKEVGIRKVLGTERKSLIGQFIVESTVTAYLAFAIAIVLVIFLLPIFNDISAKSFTNSMLFNPKYLPYLLLLPLIVGVLAGYYPALFLSAYKPIEALKSKVNASSSKSNLRNGLVVFQFAISLILIVGTIIIYRQLNYIRTKDLGFNKDQLLNLHGTSALENNKEAFKNEVLKITGVKSASFAGYLPVDNSSRSSNTFSSEAVMTQNNGFNMEIWNIEYDYLNTLGMKIIKGRSFDKKFGSDSSAVIVNETAAQMISKGNPIGKNLYFTLTGNQKEIFGHPIIGVVKNFNFSSMKEKIGPLCFRLDFNKWEMVVKLNAENPAKLINQIEQKWKAMAPGMPFKYSFVNDDFDSMYRAEQQIGKVLLIFAILTIFIACLGLFGLVTYMSEQRTKEIGIRKVLGASVVQLINLLAKDFLILVMISTVLAFPIAYWMMQKWLEDYVYRTNINLIIFVYVGIGALAISLLTVSYQAIKAALMNPVKSLKTE